MCFKRGCVDSTCSRGGSFDHLVSYVFGKGFSKGSYYESFYGMGFDQRLSSISNASNAENSGLAELGKGTRRTCFLSSCFQSKGVLELKESTGTV